MRPFLALFAVACAEPGPERDRPPEVDGPMLSHDVPEGPFEAGQVVTLSVEATDPDGVREVALYHRIAGASEDLKTPLATADGTSWSAEIELRAPGLDYAFRAWDDSDFHVASTLPEAGTFGLPVDVAPLPVPFVESFDVAASALDLYALGWTERSLAASAHPWELSQVRSTSAPTSVRHRRGVDDGSAHDDWLVSPVLDLSGVDDAQLTWQEHGSYAALASHSLWVSTGSAEPADGAFVLVEELEPPAEGVWRRSDLVDLSAWAGEPRVVLAWRYEGSYADEWTIDDIRVEALGPDLHVTSLAQSYLTPGETGELTLVLENRGAPAATVELVGETDAVFFSGPVAPGTLTIPIPIGPSVPDDSLLPVLFTATADGRTSTFADVLLVGDPSLATVAFTLDETGFVEVVLGDGLTEIVAFAGVLGPQAHELEVDLTGAATLPPAPAGRWYVRLDGAAPGELTGFSIAHDGVLYVGDDLGGFDGPATFWLPSRPAPDVTTSAVDPVLTPAGAGLWSFVLDNDGGETVGATTLTLSSPDGRLAFDVASFDLGADWTGSFAADVAVTVTDVRDSRPVPVELTVTDAVESYVAEAALPVPWPVLAITGVVIDDGLLDPGDSGTITVTVANVGDLGTGPTTCALSGLDVLGGPVSVDLAADASADLPFDVALVGGAVGDELPLTLTCGDLVAEGTLVVGEPQWTWLTALPDAYGDAVGGYAFDVHHARWRVVGDILELEVVSDTPFDPAAVLIEAWMSSNGAAWDLYQVTALGGVGTLRGYTLAAWWVLDPPVVSASGDRVRVEVELADLALTEDSLQIGLAAGFCGGSTYFCDHYPDGWGDPYGAGLVTSAWAAIGW